MKKIVIFGIGKIADVAYYFFKNHSDYNIVAMTCDRDYIVSDSYEGLPVVPFDDIQNVYPPESYAMFVALGYQELNSLRERKCTEAKEKGYDLISFIHPESGIPKDTVYGENCFVMNNVCIHPKVKLGNNVFVWSGAMIGHHTEIGDNCWLTSCCNVSGVVKVRKNCFFAVGATIGHGLSIGNECFIGANALVTKSIKDGVVLVQEPTPIFRLNSRQFIRFSKFSEI